MRTRAPAPAVSDSAAGRLGSASAATGDVRHDRRRAPNLTTHRSFRFGDAADDLCETLGALHVTPQPAARGSAARHYARRAPPARRRRLSRPPNRVTIMIAAPRPLSRESFVFVSLLFFEHGEAF
ncbi:hypothetical protein EVAR_4780_1 [Eumeta japonica]|uniref:Uncharacterized protein n=1 Tax=Eumeta variegata TaxID=151549 RepID=A0A4C1T1I7_EUMVA|nr:hypothetical protein EVAR_4780_1 [Eumeta japonica]